MKNRNTKTENRQPAASLYSQPTPSESHCPDTRVISEFFELDIFIRCNLIASVKIHNLNNNLWELLFRPNNVVKYVGLWKKSDTPLRYLN